MPNFLEHLFEEKSRGTACGVLYTQWLLAKDYIPKVQAVIIRTFPHYSLHDASHSESILNCITRVVGKEAMGSLSSVDLWLLLSAAYYHDYGMAVFASDIEMILNDSDFFQFVKECQDDQDNPLNPFAQVYDVRADGIYFKEVPLSGNTYDGARFLLADFIRREHAKRSNKLLTKDESIHLPGDPIPERLIRLLGRICEAHTQGFEQVMQLPKTELGLGMDDCHPRFVASMLRVGDLLDLDNNRFSSVLMRTLPVIPQDSLLHKKKHLSIEHLRIDEARVEVSARCDEYEVADITNHWLEMISDEFHRQKDVWQEIVPEGFPGHLPSVGELKVDLEGYDTIDGKKRPGFEIDTGKAIELLQGAGMYTNPAQSIRELLQNAVDAIYLSLFLEEEGEFDSVNSFWEACKRKKIKMDIRKSGIEGDSVVWHVRIEDNGLGMNPKDVGYLIKTGSKNSEKIRIIEKMPEYMRPSGTFGIGFQSVFLMTDKVLIRTRKINTSEELAIELYNPAGPRKGAVLMKTSTPSSMHNGTILEFDFKSDKNLDHWSVSSGQFYAQYTVYSYDFVADKTMDLDVARVLDETLSFCRACPVPMEVSMDGENLHFMSESSPSLSFDFYSQKQGLQLSIVGEGETRSLELFYRNQIVQKPGLVIPFLMLSVNILAGNAKDLLTLNRNELRYQAKMDVRNRIVLAVGEMLKESPQMLSAEMSPLASMFVHRYFPDKMMDYHPIKDKWRDYMFHYYDVDEKKMKTWSHSFGQIVSMAEGNLVVWVSAANEKYSGTEWVDGALVVKAPDSGHNEFSFLLGEIAQTHRYPSNDTSDYDKKRRGFLLSCEPVDPIKDWALWTKMYLHYANYGRALMPCNRDFRDLELKEGTSFLFASDSTFPVNNYPQMICPYVRDMEAEFWHPNAKGLKWNDADGDLYTMTYEHRAHPEVTLENIIDAYRRFRDLLDPIIEEMD